jgi:hypothetical protein
MVRVRNKFYRWKTMMRCWHCRKRADGTVAWKGGAETPECVSCAVAHCKIKIHGNLNRIRKKTIHSKNDSSSAISEENSPVEMNKVGLKTEEVSKK